MAFEDFFQAVTGHPPYPYQSRLGQDAWPEILDVPTGLGKTAGIGVAWIYKRLNQDDKTPRRLIYCLPMRVLVEQTHRNFAEWLDASRPFFEKDGNTVPGLHMMMGGDQDASWAPHPEDPAIIIGTQDMLLSRALMRGYGMSRYQWPVHFALLHNDAFWVYDEVQLMGPALPTSAQLEAFRRNPTHAPERASRSLWASATLQPQWLSTVDMRPFQSDFEIRTLGDNDRSQQHVLNRLAARKSLTRATTVLDNDTSKSGAKKYIASLAEEILAAHREGTQTLVIVNRVERAQDLFKALKRQNADGEQLLLHARFRPAERREIEHSIHQDPGNAGRIIVATQAIEAGVDISSCTLFTELAPWASLVQRFGRCNRSGEYSEADVFWIDVADDADEAAPYDQETLAAARILIEKLLSASPADLPPVDETPPVQQVLRRKDLWELFNTDPDLSGFDIDIAPYIRDSGTPQAQVFWRDFEHEPGEQGKPLRDELCPVGLGQLIDHLKKHHGWEWDPIDERWRRRSSHELRPGMTLLLRSADGGYEPDRGFVAKAKGPVALVVADNGPDEESYGSDRGTTIGRWVPLTEHLGDVASQARELCERLDIEGGFREAIVTAARWHDVGKAHPAFQNALAHVAMPPEDNTLWAKSDGRGRLRYLPDPDEPHSERKHFRHELASTLLWLEHNPEHQMRDLVAYLIAAHHGKVRMGLRSLPGESEPPDDRPFARGIWHKDKLPAVPINGTVVPPTTLRLDLMRLGDGPQGPSWIARTQRLLEAHGPFRLAWLEASLRIADWRGSAMGDSLEAFERARN